RMLLTATGPRTALNGTSKPEVVALETIVSTKVPNVVPTHEPHPCVSSRRAHSFETDPFGFRWAGETRLRPRLQEKNHGRWVCSRMHRELRLMRKSLLCRSLTPYLKKRPPNPRRAVLHPDLEAPTKNNPA